MSDDNKPILKLLKLIARLLPPLAKSIDKLANTLLARTEGAQDIITRRFEDAERRERQAPRQTDQQAAPDGVERMVSKEEDELPSQARTGDSTATSAQELTLRQIQEDFQDGRARHSRTLARITTQETLVFRLMIIFAIVAFFFVIWGGYLIFEKGLNILAILTEFLGVIGGSGSLILRRLQDSLKERAEVIEREQEQQTKYFRAIQTALALTGPEREKILAETARWLREPDKRE